MKADLHAIGLKAITISDRRTHLCTITQRHDRKRLWRGPDGPMVTARMVGMTMRHQRAFGGTRWVNPHVRWLDINAMRMWFYPMLGGGAGDYVGPFLRPDMGCSKDDVNQSQGYCFIMLMRGQRSEFCVVPSGHAICRRNIFQHFDLPWLHYIDVMVFVLVSSVPMALAVNRLVFGNRAIFIFSREGRALRAAEA